MKFFSIPIIATLLSLSLAATPHGAHAAVVASSTIDWSSFNIQLIDLSDGSNAPEFRWTAQNGAVTSWAFAWTDPPSDDYPKQNFSAADFSSQLTTDTVTTLSQSRTTRTAGLLESHSQSATDNFTNGSASAGNDGSFELNGNGLAILTLDWQQSVSGGGEGDIYNWANATTNIYASYSDTDGAGANKTVFVSTNTYDAVPQDRNGSFIFVISGDGEHLVSGTFGATASTRTMISRPGDSGPINPVPLPASAWLFGSALLGGLRTRRCRPGNR
ncbi:VPLPA-CTERM sorting domain-containing protein [Methylomonas sp. EFPC3]|uniref:VPLPA-CTERM sorting domain-containing protein n=1 Tax=Methylomonas sp. EFPC3 TaxID=3021710 RepID=UPI0024164990|nr:VPLPA-CTERM sorting domain-containing protein [Methylomonas sp. EFPC3]WFP49910.1 VPLPA-CTERM sorting domain-containing protein [Methylomonas sp. EFPC3]